jgi:hypothetical protein
VVKVKNLVHGGWIRAIVIDPTQGYKPFVFNKGKWEERPSLAASAEEESDQRESRSRHDVDVERPDIHRST